MKNENPSGKNLKFATTSQRLLAIAMLLVFAGLIWLAWEGRYDTLMRDFGDWLQRHYDSLRGAMRS